MPYAVYFNGPAAAALAGLENNVQRQISRHISALAQDPRPANCKLLYGSPRVYRVRSGDYRVLYQIDDSKQEILIVDVGNRSNIYRRR